MRFIYDFYEVRYEQLAQLRHLSVPKWRTIGSSKRRWRRTLTELRRPIPAHEEVTNPYFGTLVVYLVDNGVLPAEPVGVDDFLMDLVEIYGGGWDWVGRDKETLLALDSATFDQHLLQRYFESIDMPAPPDVAIRMREQLPVLRAALAALGDGKALLVHSHG